MRHHRDERRGGFQVAQVAEDIFRAADRHAGLVQFVVRAFQETAEQPELVEDFHGRGMDRVAAEIAEEVGMLFEHGDRDAGTGEQQPGHHPGRPATDDQHVAHGRQSSRMFTVAMALFRDLPSIQSAADVMTSAKQTKSYIGSEFLRGR